MAKARWCDLPGSNEDLVLKTAVNSAPLDETCGKSITVGDTIHMNVSSPTGLHAGNIAALLAQFHDASAPPVMVIPGLHIDRIDWFTVLVGVSPTGTTTSLVMPPGAPFQLLRWQALAFGFAPVQPANGYFFSDAHDMSLQ